mmetsp:Transcript_75997/g.220734  ORF Transcript_75997/g.220734 Transcript_75997/m.220734 type:complete len:315 (-) Transcript_75997:16-960(-)
MDCGRQELEERAQVVDGQPPCVLEEQVAGRAAAGAVSDCARSSRCGVGHRLRGPQGVVPEVAGREGLGQVQGGGGVPGSLGRRGAVVPGPPADYARLRPRAQAPEDRQSEAQGRHPGDVGQGVRCRRLQPRPRAGARGGLESLGSASAAHGAQDRRPDGQEVGGPEGDGGAEALGAEHPTHSGARRRPHGRVGRGVRAEVVPGAGAQVREGFGVRALRVPHAPQGRRVRGAEAGSREVGLRGHRARRSRDDGGHTRPCWGWSRFARVVEGEAGPLFRVVVRREGERDAGHLDAVRPSVAGRSLPARSLSRWFLL